MTILFYVFACVGWELGDNQYGRRGYIQYDQLLVDIIGAMLALAAMVAHTLEPKG